MNKNRYIPLLIVLGGLILGILFSLSTNSKKSTQKSPAISKEGPSAPISKNNNSKSKISDIKLKSESRNIKATSMDLDIVNDSDKIDKTKITISYKNSSSSEIKGAKILLNVTPQSQIGSYDTNTSTYNVDESKAKRTLVFDIPSIKPNSEMENTVLFFGREGKELKIQAILNTPDGESIESDFIKLLVE